MTRALAYQVPATITVNTLSPGWINTDLVNFARIGPTLGIDESAARANALSSSVQHRILEPEELTPMAVLANSHFIRRFLTSMTLAVAQSSAMVALRFRARKLFGHQ